MFERNIEYIFVTVLLDLTTKHSGILYNTVW